jgi:hypothetical protein
MDHIGVVIDWHVFIQTIAAVSTVLHDAPLRPYVPGNSTNQSHSAEPNQQIAEQRFGFCKPPVRFMPRPNKARVKPSVCHTICYQRHAWQ